MSLHPLTLKSIEAVFKRLGGCSCEEDDTTPKGWWLCPYHRGFEDAAVAQQEWLDEAVPEGHVVVRADWLRRVLHAYGVYCLPGVANDEPDAAHYEHAWLRAELARIDAHLGEQPNG